MYPLGLLPVLRLFVPDPFALSVALAIPVLLLALWAYAILPAVRAARSGEHACTGEHSAPVHLPGSSLAHILPFFHRRFDFINQGFQLAGEAIYQFKLLRVSTLTPLIPSRLHQCPRPRLRRPRRGCPCWGPRCVGSVGAGTAGCRARV